MPFSQSPAANAEPASTAARLGFWIAVALAVLAAAAFALGIATPPRSGPFCTGPCIAYPYTDAAPFFPRDYLWMYPGILLTPLFVVLLACLHCCVEDGKKVFSLISLCFASIAAAVITVDYFVQIEVIAPSLLKGETDGVALFTQYNPHGVFIALEDLGYLMLSAAFFFAGAALSRASRLQSAIRWLFLGSSLLTFAGYLLLSWHFGPSLDYRFEITVIAIDWTVLVVAGVLLCIYFRRILRNRPA
jgi:hypothetical protein